MNDGWTHATSTDGILITELDDEDILELELKLEEFYKNTTDYTVYEKMTWRPNYWAEVLRQLEKTGAKPGRILEIGAAKSGFGEYLKCRGKEHEIAFQDITNRCRDHLSSYSNELYFCPVEELHCEKFDIVFHSYVFEHISRPRAFLNAVENLLTEGGRHIIESPRYDLFIYIPPSLRHLRTREKIAYILEGVMGNRPPFSIVKSPGILCRPYRRDLDAVHIVTLENMKAYARKKDLCLEEIQLSKKSDIRSFVKEKISMQIVMYKRQVG